MSVSEANKEKSLKEKRLGDECRSKGCDTYYSHSKYYYSAAIKHYTEAIKHNPFDATLFYSRSCCYREFCEDIELKLEDYEQCLRLDPNFVRAHINKGYALMRKAMQSKASSNISKAKASFEKALEIDKNNAEAIVGSLRCIHPMFPCDVHAFWTELVKRAMADPEVHQILTDPLMRQMLERLQTNPNAVLK